MKFRPKKRFGQSFLKDKEIAKKIVSFLPLDADVIEIGPGKGALTDFLLPACIKAKKKLKLIEIDTELIEFLENRFKKIPQNSDQILQILHADVLDFDFENISTKINLIGNLAYNISTPLLLKLRQSSFNLATMIFMLQLELADRICAKVGQRDFSKLSVMIQSAFRVEKLLELPAEFFYPRPKVKSAVLKLTALKEKKEDKNLHSFLNILFAHPRKTVLNNLSSFPPDFLLSLDVDPNLRPKDLSIEQIQTIASHLNTMQSCFSKSLGSKKE